MFPGASNKLYYVTDKSFHALLTQLIHSELSNFDPKPKKNYSNISYASVIANRLKSPNLVFQHRPS